MDLVWKILQGEVDRNHLDGDLLQLIREKRVYELYAEKEKAESDKTTLS
jgi:hypothetical protein